MTTVGVVMKDNEIAQAFHFERGASIEIVASLIADFASRKHLKQPVHRSLDEVDARRFQRLDKSRREANCDDIAHPSLPAAPGRESQSSRIRHRLAVEVRKQDRRSLVLADVSRTMDVSVTDPVLERNSPLPTGFARDRPRIRRDRCHAAAGDCRRPIARQPVRPVFEARFKLLLDQQDRGIRSSRRTGRPRSGSRWQASLN